MGSLSSALTKGLPHTEVHSNTNRANKDLRARDCNNAIAMDTPTSSKRKRKESNNDGLPEEHRLVKTLKTIDPFLQFLTKSSGKAVVSWRMLKRALPSGSIDTGIAELVEIGVLHAQYGDGEDHDGHRKVTWEKDEGRISLGFPPPSVEPFGSNALWNSIRFKVGGNLHGSTKTAAKRRLRALQRYIKATETQAKASDAVENNANSVTPPCDLLTTPPQDHDNNSIYLRLDEERVPDETFVQEEESTALAALRNLFGFDEEAKPGAEKVTQGWPSKMIPTNILPRQAAHAGSKPAQNSEFAALESSVATQVPDSIWKAFGFAPPLQGGQPVGRQLYKHQARAIESAIHGTHTLICTGTGSGKSLCFWLPVLSACCLDNDATSIILFPTKALAQDQYQKMNSLMQKYQLAQSIRISTLDGDTPHSQRTKIAESCNVILTNPDTLHASILPSWKSTYKSLFARKLRYVVVDEAHLYEGTFGAHVAMVLARLARVAAASSGNQTHCSLPTFLGASATLPWPREHFYRLFPIQPQLHALDVVLEDTSPSAAKHFFVWNPPILHQGQSLNRVTFPPVKTGSGQKEDTKSQIHDMLCRKCSKDSADEGGHAPNTECDEQLVAYAPLVWKDDGSGAKRRRGSKSILHRRHAADETAVLLVRAIQQGTRCIAFAKTRNLVEWIYEKALKMLDNSLKSKLESYRGGYRMEERRIIEQRLFSNEILGVVATNALELGVDIGGIDLTLHCGYPSSYASLLQQAGRSGRGSPTESCAVVICFNSPAEQHLWKAPQTLLAKGISSNNTIPLSSPGLVQGHLLCASEEYPLAGNWSIAQILQMQESEKGTIPRDMDLFGGKAIYEDALEALKCSRSVVAEPVFSISNLSNEIQLWAAHASMKKAWQRVSIRSIEPVNFAIVDLSHPQQGRRMDAIHSDQAILDIVPYSRVFYHAHPGAIISHRGQRFKVVSMTKPPAFLPENFSYRRSLFLASFAVPTNARYTTRPLSNMHITVIKQFDRVDFPPGENRNQSGKEVEHLANGVDDEVMAAHSFAGCGAVNVKRTVHGYKKLSLINRTEIGRSEISLPDMEFDSFGLWIDTDAGFLGPLLGDRYGEGCHALCHALLALAPLYAPGLTRTDLECDHNTHSPTRIVLFDERAGGSGCSERLWKHIFRPNGLVRAAIDLLEGCSSCGWDTNFDGGCPACLHASECLKFNMQLSKSAGIIVGKRMLERLERTDLFKENAKLAHLAGDTEGPSSPLALNLTPRRQARHQALRRAKELLPARNRQYMVGRVSWPMEPSQASDYTRNQEGE